MEVSVVSKFMLQVLGLFMRPMKESVEMIYQNNAAYIFGSSKFNKAYQFEPTSYEEGIRKTALWTLDQS